MRTYERCCKSVEPLAMDSAVVMGELWFHRSQVRAQTLNSLEGGPGTVGMVSLCWLTKHC